MEVHKRTVERIAATVRQYFLRNEPYRIFHGSTNSTRPRNNNATSGGRVVDISALGNVLHVDAARRTALVEPNVPMDRLVAATLPLGLVPPVVMEFPGITAGGGYAGTAGESSSFRHGYFDQTVRRVEMVLANGDVVETSPRVDDPRRDLFHGAAGALGTLGVTTLLELELVPARRYVKTTYQRRNSVADTIRLLRREAGLDGDSSASHSSFPSGAKDYVDGILFAKDHGVVITGEMTDEAPPSVSRPGQMQTFSHPRDPWFYLHVRDRTRSSGADADADGKTITEYIPLPEYLFRYDRGGFWVGRAGFSYFSFPFNRLTRRVLDDFLRTRMLYKALHASGHSAVFIVQDLALPYDTAEAFVDYTAETFGIWPLWLCPLRTPARSAGPTFHPHLRGGDDKNANGSKDKDEDKDKNGDDQMLNIGLWGPAPRGSSAAQCVALNRDLEHRLQHTFGGMKWLYAHAYYDEAAFWQIYDRPGYDALRAKYHATHLPSVYDKVTVGGVGGGGHAAPGSHAQTPSAWKTKWPLAGLRGLRHAIASKAYLPRTPPWREP